MFNRRIESTNVKKSLFKCRNWCIMRTMDGKKRRPKPLSGVEDGALFYDARDVL